jgi:hypothetical protein
MRRAAGAGRPFGVHGCGWPLWRQGTRLRVAGYLRAHKRFSHVLLRAA